MTDKQIIIDCVDVSGCEWVREVGLDSEYICTCNSPNKTSGYCKYNPNCYYKQLLRKQQECEELKQFLSKEPLVIQALQSAYSDYKKRSEVFFEMIEEYKQTLTEVKKIAKRVKGYDPLAKQVLQKISEVVDE